MFKVESYVTPILLSYVDKYVRDFKPADAQVSLWGGGVALHNLVLKADVLQKEVALPFTLVSGRIHELLIQVPWTKIMSEPIIVTIDTIECVLSLNPPASTDDNPPSDSPSRNTQVVEAPPGYMQALVRRIVSNIALRVHHLIVKYVQDDIVMSLNVKHLAVDSAGTNWEPSFADIDQAQPVVRRLMRLDDLTLCLDRADADGKIRFYQEPLLYRCQLDLRVLTRLVSANIRRASSLSIQLRSSKLAWGVTTDQLTLLFRLYSERLTGGLKPPTASPKVANIAPALQLHVSASNSAEPARSESWSEWAWSWLPTWLDRDGADDAPLSAAPVPLHFAAYLDHVSLVFKVLELEGGSRKRPRGVLEVTATHAAVRSYVCSPTSASLRLGVRHLTAQSRGKCVCGHLDYSAAEDEPTVYLRKLGDSDSAEEWVWPEDQLEGVVSARAVDEQYRSTPELVVDPETQQDPGQPEQQEVPLDRRDDDNDFWQKLSPQIFLKFTHEREPPEAFVNPYDCPPTDFQYSDWAEECDMKIIIEPMELRICMGLLHRLSTLGHIYRDLQAEPVPDAPMRTLTVEECEALTENLPQRRVSVEARGLSVRVIPWDHAPTERPSPPPLVLDLDLPKTNVIVNGPLYPHRVCSAACQMPEDAGPLWEGARLHVTIIVTSIQARLGSLSNSQAKPCARADIRAATHLLLNRQLFTKRESVWFSYSLKISEANVCGSSARLQAAWEVGSSLAARRASLGLRHTTLPCDALNDEESVALDVTFEEIVLRGYVTSNTNTHIMTLQSAKATALHEPKGESLKQAWFFSAPDAPTSTPYLRLAAQWCAELRPSSMDYVGLWTEPTAVCIDPLLIAWLAYRPQLKQFDTTSQLSFAKGMSSSQYFTRRRFTSPSSSGRGASKSSAELVHLRPHSVSSSEKAESKEAQPMQEQESVSEWWCGERLLSLHERLRKMLVNFELGLTLVYVTMSSASALDCGTVRDAMERHASASQRVLALSLGRVMMYSSTVTKHVWHDIKHDGPTFTKPKPDQGGAVPTDSFPWRMRLADVSCYILEVYAAIDRSGRDRSATGLRSQLKTPLVATPRTVLELVSTAVTLSVVTKALQITHPPKHEPRKHSEPDVQGQKMKYFTTGMDFKPTTLKEFVRGPAKRKKSQDVPEKKAEPAVAPAASGPVVSLGVHVHADTPPLIVRLDHDQVHIVAAVLHCFTHIVALVQRPPLRVPKHSASRRSTVRSTREPEKVLSPSDDTPSENQSELISIFEAHSMRDTSLNLRAFFWFQWVVSRATLVMATNQVKVCFDADDLIATVDLQTHYNQLKVKVASASIRHYERSGSDEWTAGVLGGRVLEAREPTNAKEDNHFLSVTITQAQISNLPTSWKAELNPKLLEHKSNIDSMWEIYVTLAPLEMVVEPNILEQILALVQEMAPRSLCSLQKETGYVQSVSPWQWPFCYVTAGGLRLLLVEEPEAARAARSERADAHPDDTFMFVIGNVTVSPYPENPIHRRTVSAVEASSLGVGGGLEGRQYEILAKSVAVSSAQFRQLVNLEISQSEMLKSGTGGENPALKWTQPVASAVITPILHAVDVGCVLAPALYVADSLACGAALELNLLSDCAVELSLEQLALARRIVHVAYTALEECDEEGFLFDEEKHGVCPYAFIWEAREREQPAPSASGPAARDEHLGRGSSETGRYATDSGLDSATTSTKFRQLDDSSQGFALKKSVSIVFMDNTTDASDYVEVFVTMGVIELSLYTVDDGSFHVVALRPPPMWDTVILTDPVPQAEAPAGEEGGEGGAEDKHTSRRDNSDSPTASKSLTETIRNADIGNTKLELPTIFPHARGSEGNLPLVHVTLSQPNLYYWRNKTQKTLQLSLFNAWVGLGAGQLPGRWHAPLLTTARGPSDPLTDIPPALCTVKVVAPAPSTSSFTGSGGPRGSARVDVERPVMLHVCMDSILRIQQISSLIKYKAGQLAVAAASMPGGSAPPPPPRPPPLYRLRRLLVQQSIESVTAATSQVGFCGSEGAGGWDSLSLQFGAGSRPENVRARALVAGVVLSTGPPGDARHVLLQPLMLGVESEAAWEAWRRAEGGLSAREPTVRACVEADHVILDLRPADLGALMRLHNALLSLTTDEWHMSPAASDESVRIAPSTSLLNFGKQLSGFSPAAPAPAPPPELDPVLEPVLEPEHEPAPPPSHLTPPPASDDHYYKDDLRSGAFKIVAGGQLPMAYQVTVHKNIVSWRYPHPRAITRLVAFPLPSQDTETPCVLELFNELMNRWEAHTHFSVPAAEPAELQLHAPAPDAVFAVMWRYRTCALDEPPPPRFEFNTDRFLPRDDPWMQESPSETLLARPASAVTAEQLSGAVRVDSCFSPRAAPRVRALARLALLCVHWHNAPPPTASQATYLEGYYVSKPLMRSHRVLTLAARDCSIHAHCASPSGALLLAHTFLSSDVLDCATGTMEHLVDEFRFQARLSLPVGGLSQARVMMSRVHAALHVPRLRTIHALALDWKAAVAEFMKAPQEHAEPPAAESGPRRELAEVAAESRPRRELAEVTAALLEGRVSLWIHNSCASALRVGQEGTDEVVPLGPGASLAYRWRSPSCPRRLRLAVAAPAADWHWSNSIPFTPGSARVRLSDAAAATQAPGGGVFLYSRVEDLGARRRLHLAGRLCPANMLRLNLLYKVRIREGGQWRTVYCGEIASETIGNSVICAADSEMALKIKFVAQDAGWSGDIPLRECPKENVPWLVKVPSEGDTPFTCVWCRVVRARSDGRVLATLWPLYVLYSHLPLDTHAHIVTDRVTSAADSPSPPLVQDTPGRGASTHLLAPGTTAARHSLSFKYRDIECPVTREAVPLHYGVTDTSVFDKRAPVCTLDEVIAETVLWLERSGQGAASLWPYSVVAKHWPGPWQPALLQPRCDVTVRYGAVRAGGGCSLEVQLCPVVLLCNAAPIALTLRAHDAAPLCKLEPGTAISPPSVVLQKPFFISVEMGRETFVSGELALSSVELGRYGTPPRGRLALGHATDLAVHCNHKVVVLTMFYEIKEEINVLGVTPTYMLINHMTCDIMVSAIAVPSEADEDCVLRPSTYKYIEPTRGRSIHGTPLSRFWVLGRWRGTDPEELRLYLCVTLKNGDKGAAPVRLGHPPLRRALALSDEDCNSVAVVITQMKHDGRWVITVSSDPCPQLVVHNRTRFALSVAQPKVTDDEPTTSEVMVVPECLGTRWFCTVQPDATTHYSTPGHCARYPPPTDSPLAPQTVTFLTFAKAKEAGQHSWCAPVAVADGEQLLQLGAGAGGTVKLRARTHPHSTHLELRDVDQHDISASDIRRRLFRVFSSEDVSYKLADPTQSILERVDAAENLIEPLQTESEPAAGPPEAPAALEPAAGPPEADAAPEALVAADVQKPSTVVLFSETGKDSFDGQSRRIMRMSSGASRAESVLHDLRDPEWEEPPRRRACDRLRLVAASLAVELAAAADARPLLALHLDRAAVLLRADAKGLITTVSISDVQVDNLQFESGQFDFAVVASTRGDPPASGPWPPLWDPQGAEAVFAGGLHRARVLLRLTHETWTVQDYSYTELSEVEVRIGPLALYVEDAYVTALASLSRAAAPQGESSPLREQAALRNPLRLHALLVHPLELTLTLHTAVRMYIALDQSPLRLSAFELRDVMTSTERLTHALTVHYLSAAILGAGWVVGGLELLGAPGALAARVGGATGGVRGVASAAAAALLRSLSAWAGSLARNLDLLAGDEEHSRRAAAARRRPPPSLMAGLAAGITNFAINILGAVGGLAHHPLVGVAVGETESGATALRRGLIGAFAKPLSATADLVAFAGHGLLTQTGWDPVPQPRSAPAAAWAESGDWRQHCVRWAFRLAELRALGGFRVLLDDAPLLLLLTHKFLVVADPDSERIVEMIDLKFCSIGPYQGQIIELSVTQRRQSKLIETRGDGDEDDEFQISAAAMARVARYTAGAGAGAGGGGGSAEAGGGEARVLRLVPAPGHAPAFHASLRQAVHHNSADYFPLL